ncbi:MAG: DUF1571 domain-containing protein [Gemmataceae bacterium]|nr:DUF1571 domain-containing protein [Gemmataceae bacterium]MDW8265761.1 DUF1571 domain-containing protein [Gemmataceae bacterium]
MQPTRNSKPWRVLIALVAAGLVSWAFGGWGAGRVRGEPTPPVTDPAQVSAQLIAKARQSYQNVRDYTAIFIKRERVGNELQPENVIAMRVRSQPFSVYLRWLAPKQLVGQEACYVAGKNNGQMRVHSNGLLAAVGWVSIDPRDPRAMRMNRHDITQAGIGNLIERIARRSEGPRPPGYTLNIGEYEYNKRRCTRVEAIAPQPGSAYAYRCLVYYDQENHLPIRFEAYDWPKPGGDPNGDLLECYSYVDLKLNVGLTDAAFNY